MFCMHNVMDFQAVDELCTAWSVTPNPIILVLQSDTPLGQRDTMKINNQLSVHTKPSLDGTVQGTVHFNEICQEVLCIGTDTWVYGGQLSRFQLLFFS